MKTVPIFYLRTQAIDLQTGKLAEATVDDDLFPLLSLFRWTLSDTRTPRPPKTILYISKQPKIILLNRMVFLLETTPPELRLSLVQNLPLLFQELEKLPRIRLLGNPWDCRFSSLDGTLSPTATLSTIDKVSLRESKIKLPPSTAFPSSPLLLEDLDTVVQREELPEPPSALDLLSSLQTQIDTSTPSSLLGEKVPSNE